MKYFFATLIVLLFSSYSSAQFKGTIQSGRPGQAIGADTVGIGVIQLQSGLDINTFEFPGGAERTNRALNNVIRLGVAERLEINSLIDYNSDTFKVGSIEEDFSGVSNFQLGLRYNLIREGLEWLPSLALQTRLRMKNVSGDYRREEIAPLFMLSAVKPIDETWTVTANWGFDYNGFDPVPTYRYVLSVSKALSEKWGSVAEFYGDETSGQGNSYYGVGLAYLINDNFQLDAYASTGNNRDIKEFYGTIGVSWRRLAFRPPAD